MFLMGVGMIQIIGLPKPINWNHQCCLGNSTFTLYTLDGISESTALPEQHSGDWQERGFRSRLGEGMRLSPTRAECSDMNSSIQKLPREGKTTVEAGIAFPVR